MIFYMFSCLRQYTQYRVKTKKKHSLLKKNVDAVCVLSSKTNEYKMVSAYRILSFEMFQRTFCSGCPIWKKKTKKDNMENDILRQNQFFNSDPKKQYEMVNEHFSNLRTQLLIIETVRRKTSIK